jgi:hypothetical protein
MDKGTSEAPIDEKPRKKKHRKLKSAWIGFFGRVLAQVVGAILTVGLGIMLVQWQIGFQSRRASSQPPIPQAVGQPRSVDEIFALFDANRDDRLAPAEVPPDMWKRLSRADTDDDGLVSRTELREARVRSGEAFERH